LGQDTSEFRTTGPWDFFFKDDRNLRRKDIARRRFKCTTACFRLPQPRLKFSGSAALHTSCTGPPQARESCLCQLASSGVVLERNGNEQSHRDGSGTESRAFSYGGSFCKSRLQGAIVRLVVYPSSNIFVGDICYSWRFSRNEPHKKIQEFLGWNCTGVFKKLKVNNLGEDVIVLVLRVLEKFRRVRPSPRNDASELHLVRFIVSDKTNRTLAILAAHHLEPPPVGC
jgi:hypothetical protein